MNIVVDVDGVAVNDFQHESSRRDWVCPHRWRCNQQRHCNRGRQCGTGDAVKHHAATGVSIRRRNRRRPRPCFLQ
jgi:hypothetical protein